MNRLILIAGLLTIMNACNNSSKSQPEPTHHDSAMQAEPAADTNHSEVKQLMDSMMMKMHQQKATGNNDIDYANNMLQHHQGAVDMAKLQEARGSNLVLKEFSRKIITDQQKEIAVMAEFISRNGATPSPNNAVFKMAMDSAMQTMMPADVKIYNDIDKDFVAQMIIHHQSALDMAKAYLQYGTNTTLRKISQDILASQGEEVKWLKEWIAKNG
jgi:uncharacterized protein (DUF305 family)